ncbi:MAG TPA: hypothetical protein VET88_05955 [Gammaproteobacteria bacterium]|nr:hypothetical protein [Gammaproteobacteria bacterium]
MLSHEDGPVDVCSGPGTPAGKDWFMILRLHGSLEHGFTQTWRPGDVELQR